MKNKIKINSLSIYEFLCIKYLNSSNNLAKEVFTCLKQAGMDCLKRFLHEYSQHSYVDISHIYTSTDINELRFLSVLLSNDNCRTIETNTSVYIRFTDMDFSIHAYTNFKLGKYISNNN
jgi:hypothetical protein